MELKKKLSLRCVGKEYLMIEPDAEAVDMTKVYALNEVAALLWEKLEGRTFDTADMAQLILNHYKVTPERAMEDASVLIEDLKKLELLSE